MIIEIKDKNLVVKLDTLGAHIERIYYDNLSIADKGWTVGRYANRINKGKFTIDGVEYHLSKNENGNMLHGGGTGFQLREWEGEKLSDKSAVFKLVSEDGDQGFPGRIEVIVSYTLKDNALIISYEAVSDKDTVVNLTNHAYFNLNGIGSGSESHTLFIDSHSILETNAKIIPTGTIMQIPNTRYDFKNERDFSDYYDNSYILDTKSKGEVQARLHGKKTGITLELYSDYPSLQLYNTDDQICLEAQEFPDAPNHSDFPSTLLKKGEVLKKQIIYKLFK